MEIFNFTKDSSITQWTVVDDAVMGGRSRGRFFLNEKGHGVFGGEVSLENNGGFSLVRHRFERKQVNDYAKFAIRLRGDGKRYQWRVKSDLYDRHNYIAYFQTNGEWQIIEIPFHSMSANFRGRSLDLPAFPGKSIEEVAFLVGNKKAETFTLEVDRIWVE